MQIFPKSLNYLPLVVGLAATLAGGVAHFVLIYYFSPDFLYVGYQPEQPVPYSHRLHAGQLGMDCRYCHANVERSFEAMIPPTQTCMGCHTLVRPDSARLAPVRESWESGAPIEWVRVHKLPDHAYFDHSAHLAAGVGCVSCHGRVDRMEVVRIDESMSMGWCLDCHREPDEHIRPLTRLTDMDWTPEMATRDEQTQMAALLARATPPETCSGCHR